jgi:CDP-diglyceride synthetase
MKQFDFLFGCIGTAFFLLFLSILIHGNFYINLMLLIFITVSFFVIAITYLFAYLQRLYGGKNGE